MKKFVLTVTLINLLVFPNSVMALGSGGRTSSASMNSSNLRSCLSGLGYPSGLIDQRKCTVSQDCNETQIPITTTEHSVKGYYAVGSNSAQKIQFGKPVAENDVNAGSTFDFNEAEGSAVAKLPNWPNDAILAKAQKIEISNADALNEIGIEVASNSQKQMAAQKAANDTQKLKEMVKSWDHMIVDGREVVSPSEDAHKIQSKIEDVRTMQNSLSNCSKISNDSIKKAAEDQKDYLSQLSEYLKNLKVAADKKDDCNKAASSLRAPNQKTNPVVK